MKKLMKSLLVMILAMSLVACSSNNNESKSVFEKVKEEGVLTISTSPDYAPLEFLVDGEVVGAEIEFAKYIADKLGVELEIKQMDFDAALTAVALGNVDMAVTGLGWREDRAESFELSYGFNKEGEASCHGLVVPTAKVDEYKTLDDFGGKIIAAQNASLQQGYTEEQIPTAKIELVKTLDMGILMVQSEKVDALACSCDLGKAFAKTYDDLSFATPEFVVEVDNLYDGNVLAVAKGETEFVEFLNDIVLEINESGQFDVWNEEAKQLARDNGIDFEE
ncbi:MAG: transporter substrate-binding domain-containing protein [Erysipelotrichales bacterium]|nr:transporter substrate-binding domain-containing protein [Erysipelotrichales bacterium]